MPRSTLRDLGVINKVLANAFDVFARTFFWLHPSSLDVLRR